METSTKVGAKKENRLPLGRFIAFRLGNFSMAANYIVMGFLSLYCASVLEISPAVTGTILMISKVIDAFGELYCGYVVDNFKPIKGLGKARPFDLLYIGQWGCTVLMYSVPNSFSMPLKIVWIFIMYSLVQSVFQSLIQSANLPLLTRTFGSKEVVVKVQSYGGVLGMFLSMAFSMILPGMIEKYATDQAGWSMVMLITAIPMIIFGLIRMLVCKEDHIPEHEKHEEKIKLGEIVEVLKENKYVWVVTLINLLIQFIPGMAMNTFYFTWVVGDIGKMGLISMVSIFLLPVMMFIPQFIKKFSVSTIIAFGAIFGILGSAINFIANTNTTLLMVGAIVSAIGQLAPPYLTSIMLMDCATLNRYNGKRGMEGTISSVNQFGGNLGQGLGAQIAGLLMAATGFVAGADVQSASSIMGIRLLYSLVPAIIYVLLFFAGKAFKLEKKIPEMMAKLKAESEVKS